MVLCLNFKVANHHSRAYNVVMISQLVSLDERAGTNVSGYKTIDDVLGAASLNFNVEKTPAHDP